MGKKKDTWTRRCTDLQEQGGYELILKNVQSELTQLGQQKVNVLCVGAVNSGKSSFIDSIHSALTGKIKSNAVGGVTSEHDNETSATERFQSYPLKCKGQNGLSTNVSFGDMPGFQAEGGVELEHVKMIIKGHVQNKYKIIKGIKKESPEYKAKTDMNDRIHCMCFVFDITTIDSLSTRASQACSYLTKWLNDEGIPFVVVLTKSDQLSKAVDGYLMELFESDLVKDAKNKLMKVFKFRENKIFPVRNYVHEGRVVHDMDVLLLTVFLEILSLGIEYLGEESETSSSDEDTNSS